MSVPEGKRGDNPEVALTTSNELTKYILKLMDKIERKTDNITNTQILLLNKISDTTLEFHRYIQLGYADIQSIKKREYYYISKDLLQVILSLISVYNETYSLEVSKIEYITSLIIKIKYNLSLLIQKC